MLQHKIKSYRNAEVIAAQLKYRQIQVPAEVRLQKKCTENRIAACLQERRSAKHNLQC